MVHGINGQNESQSENLTNSILLNPPDTPQWRGSIIFPRHVKGVLRGLMELRKQQFFNLA